MDNQDLKLSVSEASKLFAVSSKTIRRALSAGELTYIVVRGRYKISMESLIKWSETSPLLAKKRDNEGLGRYIDRWKINNPEKAIRS